MKRIVFMFLVVLSNQLFSQTQLLTVAEKSDYSSTSRYSEVVDFFNSLKLSYPDNLHFSYIGTTFEGNRILMVTLSDKAPEASEKNKKPVILINANIHAGEIEGKEAVQMLTRDILNQKRQDILKYFTVLIIPVFNIDGNEKISPDHRPYQRVKNGVGIRYNGMNMDLNRDFIKLDSPEARALVNVFNKWEPFIFIDCHTTNGSFHEEELTFTWGNNPNGSKKISDYIYEKIYPYVVTHAKKKHNISTLPYGNFDDRISPQKWQFFSPSVVYASSYFGIKGAFSFLNENYAHADYPSRVRACYAFLDSILTFSVKHKDEMLALFQSQKNRKTVEYHTDFTVSAYPEKLTVKGFETFKKKDAWGYDHTDKRIDYTVDWMGKIDSTFTEIKGGYLFPAGMSPIAEKLKQHGIVVKQLAEDITIHAKKTNIKSAEFAKSPFQGRVMIEKMETEPELSEIQCKKGWFLVSLDASQPYRQLVPLLLEPENVDSLLRFGFMNTLIYPSQWTNTTGPYPVYKIEKTDGIKIQ